MKPLMRGARGTKWRTFIELVIERFSELGVKEIAERNAAGTDLRRQKDEGKIKKATCDAGGNAWHGIRSTGGHVPQKKQKTTASAAGAASCRAIDPRRKKPSI